MIKISSLARSLYHFLKLKVRNRRVVRSLYQFLEESEYEKRFSGECYGCFRGVFETFEQAIASTPKTKPIGYNDADLATEYKTELKKNIQSYDYPILFWLNEILKEGSTVFDFGGNVGIHFYAYDKYLTYPVGLKWVVCEVPEIVNAGEELAKQENRDELGFTEKFEEADGKEILLASGSLQYVESLSLSLSKLESKPKHILINRLPLYTKGKQFVTLQNGGKVFYPQYVFNKDEFIESICALGYEMIDIWEDRVDSCNIPFHPRHSVRFYSGLYFKLGV